MPEQIQIFNQPDSDGFWSGIGGHFEHFSQVVCEFVDNSVANFVQNSSSQSNIQICLEKLSGNGVKVIIEDTGSGIVDLNRTFTMGGVDPDAPSLNEHGFGLKHALATADKSNNSWSVTTRTEEQLASGTFRVIEAKYLINNFLANQYSIDEGEREWPGDFTGTGTVIEFVADDVLFGTLSKGNPGRTTRFNSLLDFFIQDMGFYYSEIIEDGLASIKVKAINNDTVEIINVGSFKPNYIENYHPGTGSEVCDLGNGEVEIKYHFGKIKPKAESKRYYKANMSSCGVEIALNGRVLEYNLFKNIWNREKHNSYNGLLVKINVKSSDKSKLPMTRTSKNGLRSEDIKTNNLFKWIRNKMPNPIKDLSQVTHERDLFEELKRAKEIHLSNPDPTLNLEFDVFTNISDSVRVDMLMNHGDRTVIYEGKKDNTTIQDVYQLKMYWDGCVLDGLNPTEGILIASNHPATIDSILEIVNDFKDPDGNNYNLIKKTWQEEGVQYPS